ncbi:bifunctional diaminohydroxyphosphoribosylaminopyrimidine deaminase/5-amino-6-(5-phosphoribosylamino)uracil reductase RibD [Paracoccus sp. S-4012]|uniref:bifunctional diaminohydroxyphosphoribosylaminopyrimidine deaminase/5-amino-6-(5-phosphoribosylamino)uracil reductase RibD n=1 Tax=Paracoccus sp. S-4012 TaxID=2665648 RepID=UPI0012AEEDAC|nr:bifunctional diaminohydroxyphosphoribosylaminopyrimidine deaminase/5-amino-6-(5-phosphoribosylamino)uracil reductase RibD [Paracoccus sp. S-4012]MRX50839.1 bifunctional diaminohydroxyphosphoribosylaminopyrimidine deaminase/5-amino-6-(5-phosphoribosylamino)uracil reductase RibD [Paracoccus sp. S-4012]
MDHALRLARRGLGQVWPNPAVGCVIVKDGVVVGRGWTRPGGRPHAEAVALAQAGGAARGATAFVTLEPCAHHGRTPPCAEALIAAGVARVVTALTDPDPRVAGRGHAMLRAAGIDVVEDIRAAGAAEVNRGFLLRVTEGRPMVTLKLALSLDGRIATSSGESRWITGEAARHRVHLLRFTHDAVLVGGGTARADAPRLDVRGFGEVAQPLRIVLARGAVPPLPEGAPVWHLHGPGGAAMAGSGGIAVPVAGEGLDLRAALAALGARGLTRVLCEGGGRLAAGLLAAGLVDELVVMQAGLALGAEGRPGVGLLALSRLADARRFRLIRSFAAGPDLVSVWRPA